MRLSLQIFLGVLSLIPVIVSFLGVAQGVKLFIDNPMLITAQFDSQYRYITGYYLSLSLIVWWIIPQIEKQTTILRIVCGGIFFGGVGRVVSMLQTGLPSPITIGFTCLELLLPLACVWQAKLPKSRSTRN